MYRVDRAAKARRRLAICALTIFACCRCTGSPQPAAPAVASPAAVVAAPAPAGEPAPLAPAVPTQPLRSQRSQAQIVEGTGKLVAEPPAAPTARVDVGADGGLSFNFVNADVREVLRETLGEQLRVGYVVDSRVQAVITAQTGGPLPRQAMLPTIEAILRANGLGMIENAGIYRILPIEDAAKSSLDGATGRNQPGFGIRVIPLRYVSAAELKAVLDSYAPPGGSIQIDAARNLLIVNGAQTDLNGVENLVKQFDVDWLAGTSFALYPLRVGSAKEVAAELGNIFGEGGSGPLAGIVRIVPLERLNAILVISPQRRYLQEVRNWIDRLDYGDDETTPRLFEYHVQNSRAVDLAAVLTKLLSSGEVSTVQPETAPGARSKTLIPQMAQSGSRYSNATGGGLQGGIGIFPPAGGSPQYPPPGVTAAPSGGSDQSTRNTIDQALGSGSAAGTVHAGSGLDLPQVRVVADEKNNAVVTYARPRDYRMIEDVIRRLDVVPLQVLIEATVAEVTLNDELSYGLQFFLKRGANVTGLTTATALASPPTGGIGSIANVTSVFPGFNYVLSTGSARAILNLLSSVSHVDVVSSPQILVLDHQTAALQVGDQVPIVTQSATSVITVGAPIVNSIDYRNTGVLLQVTPRVNASGLITLDIDQEVSDVKATTTSTIDSPTITERRIVSSVVTQDGETVALGGLILDKQDNERSGIPLLSDIPVLGPLFRSTTKSRGRTELLVLLSPKIIRNGREAHDMTQELQNRMAAVKPLAARIR